MNIFSKKNLYLTLWVFLGFFTSVLVMGILAWVVYYIISFNPSYYFGYKDVIFPLGRLTFAALIFISIYLSIALGELSWQKIYVEGIRGKKYVIK